MPGAAASERRVLQDDFDNDVDALLEEGLCAPKKRRTEERYGGDSDHPSDGETSVQPMMTKIKTVLKSESGREAARWESAQAAGRRSGRLCASAGRRVPSGPAAWSVRTQAMSCRGAGRGHRGVEATDGAVLSVGAACGPRLSSGFCAECWGNHWKQAGLIPQSAVKARPVAMCGQRWRGHGYTGKSGWGAQSRPVRPPADTGTSQVPFFCLGLGVPLGVGWAAGRGWRDSGTQVMPSAEHHAGGQHDRRNRGVASARRFPAAERARRQGWARVCRMRAGLLTVTTRLLPLGYPGLVAGSSWPSLWGRGARGGLCVPSLACRPRAVLTLAVAWRQLRAGVRPGTRELFRFHKSWWGCFHLVPVFF